MADTVARTIHENTARRAVVKATLTLDGSNTADLILVDRSALAVGPDGTEAGRLVIESMEWVLDGLQLIVEFDGSSDVAVMTLAGIGEIDFTDGGRYQGVIDTATGATGDILGTPVGSTAGDAGTVVIYCRKKD